MSFFKNFYRDDLLESSIDSKLTDKVINRRNQTYHLFKARYAEMLPFLITYKQNENTAIDPIKIQVALSQNRLPVVGKTKNDKIMFLGLVKNDLTITDPDNFFSYQILTSNDIEYKIPKPFVLENSTEITNLDDCATGEFVVIRNKALHFTDDYQIIDYYAQELAEICASRYSLIMQAKFQTWFKSDVGDESINQMITEIYNGSPFIKSSDYFDPEEQIIHVDNPNLSQNLESLKKEYQHKLSELNTMLGINSLAVDKESGVSDVEAKSNSAFTTTNANIKIESQQNSINRLNKRYNLNISVLYNDDAISELSEISELEKVGDNIGEVYNNDGGNNQE